MTSDSKTVVFSYKPQLAFSVFLLTLIGCQQQPSTFSSRVLCTADGMEMNCSGHVDNLKKTRSQEASFSGNYSVKVVKGQSYAFKHLVVGLDADETILVRVKRNSPSGTGVLIASASNPSTYSEHEKKGRPTSKEGWDLLQMDLSIPEGLDSLWIYVANTDSQPAYFDDLEIIRLDGLALSSSNANQLQLFFDSLDLAKMSLLRDLALAQGFLSEETKQSFPAVVAFEGQKHGAEARFKGDWPDHLKTYKWSYRVKPVNNQRFFGMTEFSIQHPKTRGYMSEWFVHQLFEREDVLTTKYEFAPVVVNSLPKGVFAVEEHFSFDLPKRMGRKKGVILKFDESLFWKRLKYKSQVKWPEYTFPLLSSATIIPFKQSAVLKSKSLSAQFEQGRNLMQRYAYFDPNVSEYLDLDKTARYYALMYLTGAIHGTNWHNQRWYFNAESEKLEPIGFDCMANLEASVSKKNTFGAILYSSRSGVAHEESYLQFYLFKNPEFFELFHRHIKRYCAPTYLDSIFQILQPEIERYEKLLGYELGEYHFDQARYVAKAEKALADLPTLENWFENDRDQLRPFNFKFKPDVPRIVSEVVPLKVYPTDNSVKYDLCWFGAHQLTVVGVDSKLGNYGKTIPAYPSSGSTTTFNAREAIKTLSYTIEGSDSIITVPVIPWSKPKVN